MAGKSFRIEDGKVFLGDGSQLVGKNGVWVPRRPMVEQRSVEPEENRQAAAARTAQDLETELGEPVYLEGSEEVLARNIRMEQDSDEGVQIGYRKCNAK